MAAKLERAPGTGLTAEQAAEAEAVIMEEAVIMAVEATMAAE